MAHGDLVLVTGANGFIAAHCVQQLLEKGYSVRGTVRSAAKGTHLTNLFAKYGDKFSVVVVDDITKDGAFDSAVKDCDFILHVASPFYLPKGDAYEELVIPATKGTVGVLQSVYNDKDSKVKRVVVTSSFAAVVDVVNKPANHEYTEADWNESSKPEDAGMLGYRASKTLAERAAWKFVEDNQPKFDIVTINPPLVIGALIHETSGVEQLNTSTNNVYNILKGNPIPPGAIGFVDVKDVAKAHVLAIEVKEAGGKRFLCASDFKSFQEVADILRKLYPKEPIAEGKPGVYDEHPTINATRAKTVLGMTFIPIEESLKTTCDELIALRDAKKLNVWDAAV
ncbi:hypothetical protein SmJEL517_g03563 [Synchytrium microbalum]|uniref:NAD-dependent epimerase/dehydratase domain-containing protein n=1 Tax=Synchytrium microbalum TaxID=1806994 RepID=A0A507C3F1_9FUNG|nr:uncharacterized protein SmJEL517_g03563 [Synchytrium microbalum]TPX33579.1 hypothetical protein SmJEL517_g03563 [Synchytrium microbalum]